MTRVAYCGLDRQRTPIRGDEHRPCWTGRPAAPVRSAARPLRHSRARVDLIPVASIDVGLWAEADS